MEPGGEQCGDSTTNCVRLLYTFVTEEIHNCMRRVYAQWHICPAAFESAERQRNKLGFSAKLWRHTGKNDWHVQLSPTATQPSDK